MDERRSYLGTVEMARALEDPKGPESWIPISGTFSTVIGWFFDVVASDSTLADLQAVLEAVLLCDSAVMNAKETRTKRVILVKATIVINTRAIKVT